MSSIVSGTSELALRSFLHREPWSFSLIYSPSSSQCSYAASDALTGACLWAPRRRARSSSRSMKTCTLARSSSYMSDMLKFSPQSSWPSPIQLVSLHFTPSTLSFSSFSTGLTNGWFSGTTGRQPTSQGTWANQQWTCCRTPSSSISCLESWAIPIHTSGSLELSKASSETIASTSTPRELAKPTC